MRRWLILMAIALPFSTSASGQPAPAAGTSGHTLDDLGAEFFSPNPFGQLNYLNWSDLPFTISASQSFGYNSNIVGVAQGQLLPQNTPSRGDLFSTTIGGASTKFYIGAQQFFADGSYGITRYRVDTADNTHQYSLDAGTNWQITSRCSGRLVVARNEFQSPIEEQIGSGINSVLATSFNETAKCLVSGYTGVILDSGWSSMQNSNPIDALNDYDSVYVRGGFEYSLTDLDTFRASTTVTQRQFTGRETAIVVPVVGLATGVEQIDYQLHYNRVISPKLTFDGMVGVTQITTTPASTTQSSPVYSAALTWQPTPKFSLGLSSARSVGAPSSTLSNAETTTTQSATANFQFSAKISLQAGIAESTIVAGSSAGPAIAGIGSGTSLIDFCKASYTVTPFLVASASYRYSDRTTDGAETKDSTFMLGLSYAPH
jgi:hypothetical protein